MAQNKVEFAPGQGKVNDQASVLAGLSKKRGPQPDAVPDPEPQESDFEVEGFDGMEDLIDDPDAPVEPAEGEVPEGGDEDDDDEEEGDSDTGDEDDDEDSSSAPEISTLQQQVADLQAKITELTAQKGADSSPSDNAEDLFTPVDVQFTEDDFAALQDNPDEAKKVLNTMLNGAMQKAITHSSEAILKRTARMMAPAMARMADAYVATAFFRRENRDLMRDGAVADMIHSDSVKISQAHPTWPAEKVLRTAGKQVRQRLTEAAEKARMKKAQPGSAPAAPKGKAHSSGARQRPPAPKGLQSDMLGRLKKGL